MDRAACEVQWALAAVGRSKGRRGRGRSERRPTEGAQGMGRRGGEAVPQ
jgi:hypothetical protein